MDATTPGPLAPDLLEREDVRSALADTTSQPSSPGSRSTAPCPVAASHPLPPHPGKISTIISGHHQVTSFEVICRISDRLRIPGHLLGLAPRAWKARPAEGESFPEPEGERPSTDEVSRRPDAAVTELRQALARRDPEAVRGHALDRIRLARCRFLLGDVTGAVNETPRGG